MNHIAWQLEHSVDVDVSLAFAWGWRTNIETWHDPPAQFQLDGPFADGACGTTRVPGQPQVHWQIRDVRAGESFVIDMSLDRAVLSSAWRFEALSDRRTRMTQRLTLSGDNASAYVAQVDAGFGANIGDGMRTIADAMMQAERQAS